eukprot:Hpha_TRINITY_DN23793_c0_g1::TRINITY_DN23793_c0_g1_i1::g.93210::m.93210
MIGMLLPCLLSVAAIGEGNFSHVVLPRISREEAEAVRLKVKGHVVSFRSSPKGLVMSVDGVNREPATRVEWRPDLSEGPHQSGWLTLPGIGREFPLGHDNAANVLAAVQRLSVGSGVTSNLRGRRVIVRRRARREREENCSEVGFVHVSKAGGTGMLETLGDCCGEWMLRTRTRARLNWFHASALRQQETVGRSLWGAAYTFALVRNPWSRQVSNFLFLTQSACGRVGRRSRMCEARKLPPPRANTELTPADFREWVHALHKAYPVGSPSEYLFSTFPHGNDVHPHFSASQYSWLIDGSGKLLVNDVFKLEELEDKWPTLQRRICGLSAVPYSTHATRGRGMSAGRIGRESKAPPPSEYSKYRSYYDAATKDIVAEHMRQDITQFEYEF